MTFGPFLLGAIASYVWSRLALHGGLRPWRYALPASVAAVGVALAAFAGDSFPVLLAGVTLAAVGIYAAIPIFWSMVSASLTGAAAASGLALVNTVGSLGGFLAGYATGWLRDATGTYTTPFVVMAVSLAVSGLLAATAYRGHGRRVHPESG
ncbi:hypothetical protein C8E95_1926 [Pseudonocardia autotrophica]|uniref:Putative tartrate transporter n=1 Tax=Pseudonocardia autotrophica TaxID=2074 RepID=A0A1Y2MYZ7_PSEAH|nr:putative tartrate transporter [Pseudonocardia autotrophica]TDN72858.1 hypothetical protein C8E95_1926 [Pseudonocardia autotrophica]BBG03576.1 hypothetical protein Pdca_47850 [Pseudonocardia autotrophica]